MNIQLKGITGVCALALCATGYFQNEAVAAPCVATSALTNPDAELVNADSCGVIVNVPNGPGNNDQDEADAVAAATGLTLTFLDKDEQPNVVDNGFLFTGTTFENGTSGAATTGTWAIDVQGLPGGPFSDFVVAIKDGNPLAQGLVWFNVDTSINTPAICPVGYEYCGTWAMYGNDANGIIRHGISHMDLFGVRGTALPEPGSLLLLSSILGGIGFATRRRKSTAA